jgi:hypothetical protein
VPSSFDWCLIWTVRQYGVPTFQKIGTVNYERILSPPPPPGATPVWSHCFVYWLLKFYAMPASLSHANSVKINTKTNYTSACVALEQLAHNSDPFLAVVPFYLKRCCVYHSCSFWGINVRQILSKPIAVVERSKARTVFARSNTAIVGSKPTEAWMFVCVLCAFFSVST